MRFDSILRKGQDFLKTEQGRQVSRRVADAAFGVARKASPKNAATIDKAQAAARSYLDRQTPPQGRTR